MGFGSTAKKLQRVTDVADKLQERFDRLREQVNDLSDTVEDTNERVEGVEAELVEQRELLEAIAESEDVDVENVVSAADDSTAGTSTASNAAGSGDGND